MAQQFQVGPVRAEQPLPADGEGGEVENHGQVVGQLVLAGDEPGVPVGGLEGHHGQAALAGVAVAVVRQVQRAAAPQVEGLHVMLGHLGWGRGRQPG
jgi:hypothetical protein